MATTPCILPLKRLYRLAGLSLAMTLMLFSVAALAWVYGTLSPVHIATVLVMLLWVLMLRWYTAGIVYVHHMSAEDRAFFDLVTRSM